MIAKFSCCAYIVHYLMNVAESLEDKMACNTVENLLLKTQKVILGLLVLLLLRNKILRMILVQYSTILTPY